MSKTRKPRKTKLRYHSEQSGVIWAYFHWGLMTKYAVIGRGQP